MKKIKMDYLLGELRRLGLCAAGIVVCLLVLSRYYDKLSDYRLQLFLGVIAVIAFVALRTYVIAREAFRELTNDDEYLIEKEYAESHQTYKVWQGEMHIMPSFILCRNRGRLIFIPINRIERIERRFDRTDIKKVPFARFIMDSDRSIKIGFSPNHTKDSEAAFAMLAKRLGNDKIVDG